MAAADRTETEEISHRVRVSFGQQIDRAVHLPLQGAFELGCRACPEATWCTVAGAMNDAGNRSVGPSNFIENRTQSLAVSQIATVVLDIYARGSEGFQGFANLFVARDGFPLAFGRATFGHARRTISRLYSANSAFE